QVEAEHLIGIVLPDPLGKLLRLGDLGVVELRPDHIHAELRRLPGILDRHFDPTGGASRKSAVNGVGAGDDYYIDPRGLSGSLDRFQLGEPGVSGHQDLVPLGLAYVDDVTARPVGRVLIFKVHAGSAYPDQLGCKSEGLSGATKARLHVDKCWRRP